MDILKKYNIEIISIDDQQYAKAADVGKLLNLANIRTSITKYNNTEKTILKIDTNVGKQNIIFLSEKGIKRLICNSRKQMSIKLCKELGLNLESKYSELEMEFVKRIKEIFDGEVIEEQYIVDKYRIDLYFPEYKLAIEYDEYEHKYQITNDKIRQNYIIEKLNCVFIRVKEKDCVNKAINNIYKHIKQSFIKNNFTIKIDSDDKENILKTHGNDKDIITTTLINNYDTINSNNENSDNKNSINKDIINSSQKECDTCRISLNKELFFNSSDIDTCISCYNKINNGDYKQCNKCLSIKSTYEFYKSKKYKCGYRSNCKICENSLKEKFIKCNICGKNISRGNLNRHKRSNACVPPEEQKMKQMLNKKECNKCNKVLGKNLFMKNLEYEDNLNPTCTPCYNKEQGCLNKCCTKCIKIKSIDEFYNDAANKDNKRPICIECTINSRHNNDIKINCEICGKAILKSSLSKHKKSIFCRQIAAKKDILN